MSSFDVIGDSEFDVIGDSEFDVIGDSEFDVIGDREVVEMVLLENPFRTPDRPGLKVVIACKGLEHVRRVLNDNPPPGGVDVTMNNAKLLDLVDAHIVQKAVSRQPGYIFMNWIDK